MSFNQLSDWKKLPNPLKGEFLSVPISPGVYQIRNRLTGEYVLFGRGENLAYRFCSLFLKELYGKGTRKNVKKINFVGQNLENLEYRFMPKDSVNGAKEIEREVKEQYNHLFEAGK